jgi:hypothetical protein
VIIDRIGAGACRVGFGSTASAVDVITRLRVVGLIDIAKLRESRVSCVT